MRVTAPTWALDVLIARTVIGTATPDTRTTPATIIPNWMHALKK